MDIRKLQKAIVDGLEDVKAQNIVVFNTEALSPLFERVIIASGTSNRQTKALAASVRDSVKGLGEPVPRMEGEENGEWIIVDCGAAVAHIMQPAIRDYYHLEEIWGMKPVALKSAVKKARSGLPKAEEPAEGRVSPVTAGPSARSGSATASAPRRTSAGIGQRTTTAAKKAAPARSRSSAAAVSAKTSAAQPSSATPRAAKPRAAVSAQSAAAASISASKPSTQPSAKTAVKATTKTAAKTSPRTAAKKRTATSSTTTAKAVAARPKRQG